MKFATEYQVPAGRDITTNMPNLTRKCLVPASITITEVRDGKDYPASNIMCTVYCNKSELFTCGEPSFRVSHEIDLSLDSDLRSR